MVSAVLTCCSPQSLYFVQSILFIFVCFEMFGNCNNFLTHGNQRLEPCTLHHLGWMCQNWQDFRWLVILFPASVQHLKAGAEKKLDQEIALFFLSYLFFRSRCVISLANIYKAAATGTFFQI